MFGNYLKTGLRSLLAQKLYALINLAGLSVGLTCFILMGHGGEGGQCQAGTGIEI